MNRFAALEVVFTFRKVTFYTVRLDRAARTLWEEFLDAHEDPYFKDDLDILRSAMQRIGQHSGAKPRFFRHESFRGGDASALPSLPKYLRGASTKLRLYCFRFNESSVILFCGGRKNARTPQECETVRPHFLQANQLCRVLNDAYRSGDLQVDEDGRLIIDMEIEWTSR